MPAVTLSEAAAALGFKSRSTIYRLKQSGDLAAYLTPPGPTGRQLLELEPPGLPPLREHVARLVRLQSNTPADRRRHRSDGRWAVAAAALTEALADAGGLQLSAAEAQTIAAALPAAMGEAFGLQGLEVLRAALADQGCWRAGPGTPDNPEAAREWWGDDGWGRWEPGEPLESGPFWEHVGAIVGGMMGGPFEGLRGPAAAELHRQLQEAIGSVEAGARWDPARWAAAGARSLLEDPEVRDGTCPHSLPELQALAAGGLLPAALQAEAAAALAAYAKRGAEALPVVVG
jgi:hypothetical protein